MCGSAIDREAEDEGLADLESGRQMRELGSTGEENKRGVAHVGKRTVPGFPEKVTWTFVRIKKPLQCPG
jgi:hypothetical protein